MSFDGSDWQRDTTKGNKKKKEEWRTKRWLTFPLVNTQQEGISSSWKERRASKAVVRFVMSSIGHVGTLVYCFLWKTLNPDETGRLQENRAAVHWLVVQLESPEWTIMATAHERIGRHMTAALILYIVFRLTHLPDIETKRNTLLANNRMEKLSEIGFSRLRIPPNRWPATNENKVPVACKENVSDTRQLYANR